MHSQKKTDCNPPLPQTKAKRNASEEKKSQYRSRKRPQIGMNVATVNDHNSCTLNRCSEKLRCESEQGKNTTACTPSTDAPPLALSSGMLPMPLGRSHHSKKKKKYIHIFIDLFILTCTQTETNRPTDRQTDRQTDIFSRDRAHECSSTSRANSNTERWNFAWHAFLDNGMVNHEKTAETLHAQHCGVGVAGVKSQIWVYVHECNKMAGVAETHKILPSCHGASDGNCVSSTHHQSLLVADGYPRAKLANAQLQRDVSVLIAGDLGSLTWQQSDRSPARCAAGYIGTCWERRTEHAKSGCVHAAWSRKTSGTIPFFPMVLKLHLSMLQYNIVMNISQEEYECHDAERFARESTKHVDGQTARV